MPFQPRAPRTDSLVRDEIRDAVEKLEKRYAEPSSKKDVVRDYFADAMRRLLKQIVKKGLEALPEESRGRVNVFLDYHKVHFQVFFEALLEHQRFHRLDDRIRAVQDLAETQIGNGEFLLRTVPRKLPPIPLEVNFSRERGIRYVTDIRVIQTTLDLYLTTATHFLTEARRQLRRIRDDAINAGVDSTDMSGFRRNLRAVGDRVVSDNVELGLLDLDTRLQRDILRGIHDRVKVYREAV